MTSPLAIFAALFYLQFYGQPNHCLTKNRPAQITIATDTSNISILPFEKKPHWMFKNAKPAVITDNDHKLIDSLLRLCIDNFNFEQDKLFDKTNTIHPEYKLSRKDFIIDIGRYKRQYIVVTNNKDQKKVWVNCFCISSDSNWKKEIVWVRDGGNCFFNLKINITTKKYYDLMVNGEA